MNWYLMSVLSSSVVVVVRRGMSESVQCMHMIAMCTSSCSLHLMGGISDLRIHFIWKVYCHYLHYELLNTEQCRLLYVVVIVITVAYSYCCFWSFLCIIVHGLWYMNNHNITYQQQQHDKVTTTMPSNLHKLISVQDLIYLLY